MSPSPRTSSITGHSECSECGNTFSPEPTELLLEHCFDLPDLFLNFAEVVFGFAFGFQGWIVCDFACRFFDDALYLMDTWRDAALSEPLSKLRQLGRQHVLLSAHNKQLERIKLHPIQ